MSELNHAERWAPIPDYEGYYEASALGRIRSLDRIVPYRGGTPRRIRGHILKQAVDPDDGRHEVRLNRDGKGRTVQVHRLVLLAFRGSCQPGQEGCHNNGDASDNRLENLRWDTHSENMYDRGRHGTDPKRNRIRCPRGHRLTVPNLVRCVARSGRRACLACSRAQALQKRAVRHGLSFDFQAVADECYARIMDGTYVPRGECCPRGHLLKVPNLQRSAAIKGQRGCLACHRTRVRKARAVKRGLSFDFAVEADREYALIVAA
jgi:NUMOD4 motif/HNH endonuclease